MKKIVKRMLMLAMVLTLIISATAFAFGAESDAGDIKVQYNGDNITFTDAVPKLINGRTMVPLRQVLETMGAEVSYIAETDTVSVSKDLIRFSFVIGGTDISLAVNGETSIEKMDVVPYLDDETDRVYVPVRFMADSLGCSVGWDSDEKTAVIIDPMVLFADADEDFSIIAKLFTTDLDMSKAYRSTGSFDMKMTQYNQMLPPEGVSFSMKGDIDGIQQQLNADLTINMSMDMDLPPVPLDEEDQMQAMLDMLSDIKMDVKLDEEGIMYMNSDIFSILDPSFDSNTWFKMDIFKIYDDMGMDLRPWMNISADNYSLSDALSMVLKSLGNIDSGTYSQVKTLYAYIKDLVGDEAFDKKTAGNITTYSLNLDEEMAVFNLDAKGDLIIRVKNDMLYDYDVKLSGTLDDSALVLHISGDNMNSLINMNILLKDLIDMSITADTQMRETNKQPSVEPPADAVIIDYFDIIPAI